MGLAFITWKVEWASFGPNRNLIIRLKKKEKDFCYCKSGKN